jgi:heptosyltransferase-1
MNPNKNLKILFIKLGALGDLSFALPAPQYIKSVLPHSQFTWLVGKSVSSFLKNRPEIDRLVEVNDKDLFSSNPVKKLLATADMLGQLESSYDLILIAHRSPLYSALFRSFIKGKVFQISRGNSLLAQWAKIHFVVATPLVTHESHAIRNLVSAAVRSQGLVIDESLWTGQIQTAPDEATHSSQLLSQLREKNYLVLQMGGAGNLKTEFRLKSYVHWPELLKLLLEKTDWNLFCVGAPSEKKEVQEIIDQATGSQKNHLSRIKNVVGKTTLKELEQILSLAELVVGIDSGPLHVSDALRVPTLGIFGPSSPNSWGFLGESSETLQNKISCSPCYRDDGIFPQCHNEHRCMVDLPASRVFEVIEERLKKR